MHGLFVPSPCTAGCARPLLHCLPVSDVPQARICCRASSTAPLDNAFKKAVAGAAAAVALFLCLPPLPSVAVSGRVMPPVTQPPSKDYDRAINKAIFSEAWGSVFTMYYDVSGGQHFSREDWVGERQRIMSDKSNFASRERTYDAIRDVVAAIGDPYTRFLTPEEFRAEMRPQDLATFTMAGVGLQLTDPIDGVENLAVVAPLPESPAEESGISPGDYVRSIDGIDVESARLTPSEAIVLLRGAANTNVEILLTSHVDGRLKTYQLTRRRLNVPAVRTEVFDYLGHRIAYVRIHFFNNVAREAVLSAVRSVSASDADAIVLDVRNCLGGVFQEAMIIASAFMDCPQCVLVHTLDGNGVEEAHVVENQMCALPDFSPIRKPLVVLMNAGSASSSEVLAGALHDNGRAMLVGEQSYGKGLIQHSYPLSDGSAVAMTIAEYVTPHRRHVQYRGIAPDLLCREAPSLQSSVDKCVLKAAQHMFADNAKRTFSR